MRSATQPAESRGTPAWIAYFLIVLAISVVVIGSSVAAYFNDRAHFEERALLETQGTVRVLDDHVGDMLDRIDLVLGAVASYHLDQTRHGGVDTRRLETFLADQLKVSRDVEFLRVTDADGVARYSVPPLAGAQVSFADRDYFLKQRDAAGTGLVVAGPLMGRVAGKWVLIVSRRLQDAEGGFAGIVFAGFGLDKFEREFTAADVGRRGAVTLRTDAMALVFRKPAQPGPQGAIGSVSEGQRARYLEHPEGHFRARSPIDGLERIYAFRKVGKYPFYIEVGRSTDDIAEAMLRNTHLLFGLTALVILISVVAAWRLHGAGGQRGTPRLRHRCRQRRRVGHEPANSRGLLQPGLCAHAGLRRPVLRPHRCSAFRASASGRSRIRAGGCTGHAGS